MLIAELLRQLVCKQCQLIDVKEPQQEMRVFHLVAGCCHTVIAVKEDSDLSGIMS